MGSGSLANWQPAAEQRRSLGHRHRTVMVQQWCFGAAAVLLMLFQSGHAQIARVGNLLAGRLSEDDRRLPRGRYFDLYVFDGEQGQQVTVEVNARDFNLVVVVRSQEDNVVAEHGEGAPATASVTLSVQLPVTGPYLVFVTSLDPGATGGYTLRLTGTTSRIAEIPSAPGHLGPPGATAQDRERFHQLQPVFALFGTVVGFLNMEQSDVPITSAQAQTLVPIVEDLTSRTELLPDDAGRILETIRTQVLTAEQVAYLDQQVQVPRFRLRQANPDQRGFVAPPGTPSPGPENPGSGQPHRHGRFQGFFGGRSGQGGELGGGRGGFGALMLGEDVNPFRVGPGLEIAGQVLSLLSARSRTGRPDLDNLLP